MYDTVKKDIAYYNIVCNILESDEFIKRKKFRHHNNSVYEHSLKVSYYSYKVAKKLKLDYRTCAVAGLLHDFYKKPWQDNKEKKPFFKLHGFTHANEASINAQKFYPEYMNKKIINSIKRHMFPLNITPPKYIEGWIITNVDKYVSLDVFLKPKELYKYIGIKENSWLMNYLRYGYLNFVFTLYMFIGLIKII